MRVCHVAADESMGGAARAAFRLHKAMLESNVQSTMLVSRKRTDAGTVTGPNNTINKVINLVRPTIGSLITKIQRPTNQAYRSFNIFRSSILDDQSVVLADLVNLHWVGGEALSIGQIGSIHRPHVWTLHDMWAFCGAEHLAPCESGARWKTGYPKSKDATYAWGVDLDRWVWKRKKAAWRHRIPLIAPSRWLAGSVRESALMQDWPVYVIPNVLDVERFRPLQKELARQLLGLPLDVPVILFGAMGGGRDPNKGWDLLCSALQRLVSSLGQLECVVFGQTEPLVSPQLGMPIHWLGHLHDDVALALVYSAADVMVVPSRQENLPQSGTEAQSCGCPVVAFDCTGLPDVVEHKVTGYLATAYDPLDLANGVRWVLEDSLRHAQLSHAARERALRLWAPNIVIPRYLDVYQQAIDQWNSQTI